MVRSGGRTHLWTSHRFVLDSLPGRFRWQLVKLQVGSNTIIVMHTYCLKEQRRIPKLQRVLRSYIIMFVSRPSAASAVTTPGTAVVLALSQTCHPVQNQLHSCPVSPPIHSCVIMDLVLPCLLLVVVLYSTGPSCMTFQWSPILD